MVNEKEIGIGTDKSETKDLKEKFEISMGSGHEPNPKLDAGKIPMPEETRKEFLKRGFLDRITTANNSKKTTGKFLGFTEGSGSAGWFSSSLHFEAFVEVMQTDNSVTELSIEGNYVQSRIDILMNIFTINSTLKVLHLSHNFLNDTEAESIAKMLQHNKSLEVLSIENNQLRRAGVVNLATALKTNKTLTTLNLKNNTLMEDPGIVALAMVLQKENTTLSALTLDLRSATDESFKAIAGMVESNKTILDLTLIGGKMSVDAALILAVALNVNTSLCNLYFDSFVPDDAVDALADVLVSRTNMEIVAPKKVIDKMAQKKKDKQTAGKSEIAAEKKRGAEDARRDAESTKSPESKERKEEFDSATLKLPSTVSVVKEVITSSDDNINKALRNAFSRIIANSGKVLKFEKDSLHLTTFLNVTIFVDVMRVNQTVTDLNIEGDYINNESAIMLSELLSNKAITRFRLVGNNIGDQGVMSFVQKLNANETLQELELGGSISTQCAKELASALKTKKTHFKLDLTTMILTDEGALALVDVIKSNKLVTVINEVVLQKLGKDTVGAVGAVDTVDESNSTPPEKKLSVLTFSFQAKTMATDSAKGSEKDKEHERKTFEDDTESSKAVSDKKNNDRREKFFTLVKDGNVEELQDFLVDDTSDLDLNVNTIDETTGRSALHCIFEKEFPAEKRDDMLEQLLRSGASCEIADYSGKLPLHMAAEQGYDFIAFYEEHFSDSSNLVSIKKRWETQKAQEKTPAELFKEFKARSLRPT